MTPRQFHVFDPSPTGPRRRYTEEEPVMSDKTKDRLTNALGVAVITTGLIIAYLTGKKWA